MTSRILSVLGCTLALAACHDDTKSVPEAAASAAPPTPMGMASAVTFVAAASPVVVLATLHHPKEAVLAGDALIVADRPDETSPGTDVVSVATAAPGAPKALYPGQRGAEGLAFAGGRLVWIAPPSDDGKTHSTIVLASNGAKPTTVARTYDADQTLAASDGTDVFTFGDAKPAGKGNPDVLRVGANGKAVAVTAAGEKLVRTAIATNTTHVFWAQGGTIVRAPKTGGDAAVVVKLPAGRLQRLAADDTSVYWTDFGTGDPQWSGRVYRAAIADGKVDTISDAPSPFAIAVDGDTVYWTSSLDAGGKVLARKKSGGSTVVLASEQHGPKAIAVGEKDVYWVNAASGEVCKAGKGGK